MHINSVLGQKRQGGESKILGCKISWPCDCKWNEHFMKETVKLDSPKLIQFLVDGTRVSEVYGTG